MCEARPDFTIKSIQDFSFSETQPFPVHFFYTDGKIISWDNALNY
jgi:hypothetical protein